MLLYDPNGKYGLRSLYYYFIEISIPKFSLEYCLFHFEMFEIAIHDQETDLGAGTRLPLVWV